MSDIARRFLLRIFHNLEKKAISSVKLVVVIMQVHLACHALGAPVVGAFKSKLCQHCSTTPKPQLKEFTLQLPPS